MYDYRLMPEASVIRVNIRGDRYYSFFMPSMGIKNEEKMHGEPPFVLIGNSTYC